MIPKSTQLEFSTSYFQNDDLYPQFRFGIYENTLSTTSCPSPTIQLLNKLGKLQEIPEDQRWPPAKWPSEQAFEDAYDFIQNSPLSQVPSPFISLADDGEMNFFWDVDDIYVDLAFYGNKQCSYFAQGKFGQKVYSNAFPVNEGFPPEIFKFFLETR